jgi:murein DD-endopeptidase MepM/ murein hydrolase activator NlpD
MRTVKRMTFALAAACVAGLAWMAAGTTPNRSAPQSPPHPSSKTYTIPAPIVSTPPGDMPRPLAMPVAGIDPSTIHDTFDEMRGGDTRRHEALDILAPRGTNVLETDDGTVKRLFTSVPGGLTVYQFDPDQRYCYYYAHLDAYAPGLHEGQILRRGDLIGYVGTTGNAAKDTPHLHFAVIRLDPDKRWWTGTAIDPYPLLYKPR